MINTEQNSTDILAELIEDTQEKIDEISTNLKEKEIEFYEPVHKAKIVTDFKIRYREFIKKLYSMGFRLFEATKPPVFVMVVDNVIKEISVSEIQSIFLKYLHHDLVITDDIDNCQKNILIEKFYRNPGHYFSDNRLSLLVPEIPILFNRDTSNECFLYYANGFVLCTPDGIELKDYKDLKGGYIWRNQKIDRGFSPFDWNAKFDDYEEFCTHFGIFSKFMWNVAGKDLERFFSLCSITGYLIHSYFHYKLKAIILTDSKISEKPDGRTGKTLYGKGLSKVRKYTEINGKDFDPVNKHKYQEADFDTQIICLNDVKRNFNTEYVFNDVTEAVKVEKKNKQPFSLRAKLLITANKTMNTDGASAKDRFLEFEFSEHYSNNYSPKDEFGHWFFTEWDAEEWNRFDNLMAFCVCYFLKNGLKEAKQINLARRKLIDSTSLDFAEFMDQEFESGRITWGGEFPKKDIQDRFLQEYEDYNENKKYTNLGTFGRMMNRYAENLGGKVAERRSSGTKLIEFLKSDSNTI